MSFLKSSEELFFKDTMKCNLDFVNVILLLVKQDIGMWKNIWNCKSSSALSNGDVREAAWTCTCRILMKWIPWILFRRKKKFNVGTERWNCSKVYVGFIGWIVFRCLLVHEGVADMDWLWLCLSKTSVSVWQEFFVSCHPLLVSRLFFFLSLLSTVE